VNFSTGYPPELEPHETSSITHIKMAPKKKVERPQENVSLGPQVREGELVFGVARIFASFVSSAVLVQEKF
jgi:hypothetical protein